MTGRRLTLLACPLLAFVLYLPTLRCDFVFDDRGAILMNPLMHDLGNLPRLFVTPYWNTPGQARSLYRPLTSVSFAVDGAVSGMRPAWFHAVNAALHALATLLVTLLALELAGQALVALVAGGLFAVHPIHVEAVAGIVGRAEILAAIGVLGAVLCHRRALIAPKARAPLWIASAWAALLCGVLAKESAIVAPVLCLVTEAVSRPAVAPRRRFTLYVGYATVVMIYLAIRLRVLGSLGPGAAIPFVDNPAAAAGALDGRLTGVGSLIRYAGLLLWPRHLSADYSYDQIPVIHSLSDPLAVAGLALAIGIVAGGVWLLRRAPLCGAALLFTAVSAALTTNILFFIGTLLAERLMYLPSVGLCLLAGWAVGGFDRGRARQLVLAATALVGALLAIRAYARVPDWKDDFTLYNSAARVSPRSARIRYNLGNAHLRAGSYREAEANYRAALGLYTEFQDARVNLGMALVQQGRAGEALGLLQDAVAKEPSNPDLAINLGTAFRKIGQIDRARQEFERALRLDETSSRAWNNLGSLDLLGGNVAGAIERLTTAVRLEPDMAAYRINLGDALTAAGRKEEAAGQFEVAARLDPALPEAHRGLGEALLGRGDLVSAEREFRIAAASKQGSARAANFLGYLLVRKGQFPEAVREYERAVALDPGLADAHRSLGLLYAERIGDKDRATLHLETSLRIEPDQAEGPELRRLLARLKEPGH